MTSKRLRLTALALVILTMASGCTTTPKPEPTPTPAFASEEEAFEAAEKTYREYIDAVNARIAGETSPDPQDYLIGLALETDIDTERFMAEQGYRTTGAMSIASFSGSEVRFRARDATITATICLDASEIQLLDSAGTNITPVDREDVVAQLVEFVGTGPELKVLEESEGPAGEC
ncbi:hypothetical protein [Microbacterium sp. 179-I 3D4 NHS]|uniref:hypothetical protein n=1 Tax=Microbacterium sp. 179-I 3D4 NHS TaxID=3142381 RepID=UPI0039A192E3